MLKKVLIASAALVALLLLAVAALLVSPLSEMPRNGVAGSFLIRNVAVVDVESGTLRAGRDVILRDGKIAANDPTDPSRRDGSLITIDGSGKYLIPGLWDMHTHSLKLSPQYMHPLFIANGVTGIRDMSGCMSEPDSFFACIDDRRRWNAANDDGSGLAPRYVLQSSFQINGGNEVPDGYPGFFRVSDTADARRLVAFYRQAGADFLKPYSELSPEAYRALADEARQQGLTLAGHRPLRVSLEEVLAAGQRSVEHPRVFLEECHDASAAFRALPDPVAASGAALRWRMIDGYEAGRCAELMAAMATSDLLDANPLEDIRHTQRIAGLFFNGQYFSRPALDGLLRFARHQARSVRTNLHLLWDGLNSPLLRVQAAD